jgi:hypothetical protein
VAEIKKVKTARHHGAEKMHLVGNDGTKKERATELVIQKRYALQLAKKNESGAHVALNIAKANVDAADKEAARLMAVSYSFKQESILLREDKERYNFSVASAKASFKECMNQFQSVTHKLEAAIKGEEAADIAMAQNRDSGLSANAVKQQSKAITRKTNEVLHDVRASRSRRRRPLQRRQIDLHFH